MRSLYEIFIIGVLVYLGWDIPFAQRIDQLKGKSSPVAAGNRQSGSDSPANRIPQTVLAPVTQANVPPRQPFNTSTGLPPAPRAAQTASGSWMWDASHRSPLDPPRKGTLPH